MPAAALNALSEAAVGLAAAPMDSGGVDGGQQRASQQGSVPRGDQGAGGSGDGDGRRDGGASGAKADSGSESGEGGDGSSSGSGSGSVSSSGGGGGGINVLTSSEAIEALWLLTKLGGWGVTPDAPEPPARGPPPAVRRLLSAAGFLLAAEVDRLAPPDPPPNPAAAPRLLRLWRLLGATPPRRALAAVLAAAQRDLPLMRGESAVLLLRALAELRPSPPPAALIAMAVREVLGPKGQDVASWRWAEEVEGYCRDLGRAEAADALAERRRQWQEGGGGAAAAAAEVEPGEAGRQDASAGNG